MSMNVINDNTDTLTIDKGGIVHDYTLPHGNYSYQDILDVLNPSLELIGITLSFSEVTNHFTFTADDPFTLMEESTILYCIGFSEQDHTGTVVTSDQCVDLTNSKYFIIESSLAVNNMFNGVRRPFLCKIPNNVDTGSVLVYSDSSAFLQHVDDISITQISLSLLDDESQEVDLNGLPWSCTLEFAHLAPSDTHGKPMQDSEFFVSLLDKSDDNGSVRQSQEVREVPRPEGRQGQPKGRESDRES